MTRLNDLPYSHEIRLLGAIYFNFSILYIIFKDYNSKQMSKMTHLEIFHYEVWNKGECQKTKEPKIILFNYKERNPLTKEALTIVIP